MKKQVLITSSETSTQTRAGLHSWLFDIWRWRLKVEDVELMQNKCVKTQRTNKAVLWWKVWNATHLSSDVFIGCWTHEGETDQKNILNGQKHIYSKHLWSWKDSRLKGKYIIIVKNTKDCIFFFLSFLSFSMTTENLHKRLLSFRFKTHWIWMS